MIRKELEMHERERAGPDNERQQEETRGKKCPIGDMHWQRAYGLAPLKREKKKS